MFLLGVFLLGLKVLIEPKSSYWAHKFLFGTQVLIGHTLWSKWKSSVFKVTHYILTKFFYQKMKYLAKILISEETIIFDLCNFFNYYFKKSFLAGVPIKNKYARLEHLPNKVFWFLLGTPPVLFSLIWTLFFSFEWRWPWLLFE